MATRDDPTAGIEAIAGFPYRTDLACGHWSEEVAIILSTLEFLKLEAFVEIGVHVGGLADIILRWAANYPYFTYVGVEINESVISPKIRQAVSNRAVAGGAMIFISDAWSKDTAEEVVSVLSNPRRLRSFIYCDGGDKPRELDLWAPYAVAGDVVAVHDYGHYPTAEIGPLFANFHMAELGFEPYWPNQEEHGDLRIALWRK